MTAPAVGTDDRSSQRRLAYLLIAPAVVLMLAVTAYPIGYAIWLSLQRYNLASPADNKFVGLALLSRWSCIGRFSVRALFARPF